MKQNKALWFRDEDIASASRMCWKLFECGIFSERGWDTPFFEPCLTSLLINLSDLLQKASVEGSRITFADDVDIGEGKDVTDLVNMARNAACHVSSPSMIIDSSKVKLGVAFGLNPKAMYIGGMAYKCDYRDDIAIFYGPVRIYMARHLLTALHDVSKVFGLPVSPIRLTVPANQKI